MQTRRHEDAKRLERKEARSREERLSTDPDIPVPLVDRGIPGEPDDRNPLPPADCIYLRESDSETWRRCLGEVVVTACLRNDPRRLFYKRTARLSEPTEAEEYSGDDMVAAAEMEPERVGRRSSGTPEEILAQHGPRAMQARFHDGFTHVEAFRRLRGVESLDVPQNENGPVGFGKALDGCFEQAAQLVIQSLLFGAALRRGK